MTLATAIVLYYTKRKGGIMNYYSLQNLHINMLNANRLTLPSIEDTQTKNLTKTKSILGVEWNSYY